MGRSHSLCGLIMGVAAAGILDHAPLPVRLLVIPIAGGSALLPDIDHPSSRVARSLGIVTRLIAKAVDALSVTVYHATRTDRDVANRHSGHRLLTHTVPGCAIAGAVTWLAVVSHPVAGTVVLALLCGLLAQGFRAIGVGFTLVSAVVAYLVLSHYSSWSWVFPCIVTLGAFVHILGDWSTVSGVPLWWPLIRDGKRWELVHSPIGFHTNSSFETEVVTPVLWVSLALSAAFASGIPEAVWHVAVHSK